MAKVIKSEKQEMTTKELIIDVLKDHGCQTAFEIMGSINRKHGVIIPTTAVAGVMRPLIAKGWANKCPNPNNGKMAYWLTDEGKEVL